MFGSWQIGKGGLYLYIQREKIDAWRQPMARLDRLLREEIHDPYFVKQRYRDPSVCERCNVLFRNGAFEWVKIIPRDAAKMICPACRRIEDKFEGGVVTLGGD